MEHDLGFLLLKLLARKRIRQRAYDRKRYQANRAVILARNNAYYREHHEERIAQRRRYRDANRAAINLSEKTGLSVDACRKLLTKDT